MYVPQKLLPIAFQAGHQNNSNPQQRFDPPSGSPTPFAEFPQLRHPTRATPADQTPRSRGRFRPQPDAVEAAAW